MKPIRLLVLLMVCVLSAQAFAGEHSRISLSDGSIIYGEIKSFADGVYTVESAAFGIIKIRESDIQEIRPGSNLITGRENINPVDPPAKSDLRGLQELMRGDPETMNLVFALGNDPEFQEILKDPDILNAVNTGDIASLLSNPKFMQLLNNPKIREIQSKIAD